MGCTVGPRLGGLNRCSLPGIDGDWRLDHGDFFTTKANDKQSNQAEGQQANDGQQDGIHGADGAEYTF